MTIARTFDSRVIMASAALAADLPNVLGYTIAPSNTITQQGFLRREAQEASIHQVGASVSFTTVYDTPAMDTLVDSLLGSSGASGRGLYACFVDGGDLTTWEIIPVSIPRPGVNAPIAGTVVRPWSFTQNARAMWGLTYSRFEAINSATQVGLSLDGTSVDDALLVVLLTDVASGVTAVALADGSTNHDLNAGVGLQVIDDDTASAQLTITPTGGAISGLVLVGQRELMPNG